MHDQNHIKFVGLIFRYPLEGNEESQSTFIEDTQAAVKNLKNTSRIQSAVTLREILLGVSIHMCACNIRLS